VAAQGSEAYAIASVGFSRNAAVVNSQGREPLDLCVKTVASPNGAKVTFAPWGLKNLVHLSGGSRPWLLTDGPLGLNAVA
jgi:hypothetical protein